MFMYIYPVLFVHTGSPLKPSIEAVELDSSNVSVVWAQNRTCFSMCTFEYKLTLFNTTGSVHYTLMTTQHSTHISGLLPGVHYRLELVALCEEYTSSATNYKFILPVTGMFISFLCLTMCTCSIPFHLHVLCVLYQMNLLLEVHMLDICVRICSIPYIYLTIVHILYVYPPVCSLT